MNNDYLIQGNNCHAYLYNGGDPLEIVCNATIELIKEMELIGATTPESEQVTEVRPRLLTTFINLSGAQTSTNDSNISIFYLSQNIREAHDILLVFGFKEFNKIDFSNIHKGIDEATKKLQDMMLVATTLQQSIGQGLTNAFNSVFDAILEGRSVFKALGNAIKALVVDTIKAVAQMLILKLVTNLIFPGAGAGLGIARTSLGGLIGGAANFGQLSGIGSRAFQNVLTVNVNGQISGDTIRLAGQRAANSQGRFG